MTGKQKMKAAFTREGSREIPAVICYEDILIRDHWEEFTKLPWWYQFEPSIDKQIQWRHDLLGSIDLDWFMLNKTYAKDSRKNLSIDVKPDGVFLIDGTTGLKQKLEQPEVGGGKSILESLLSCNHAESPGEIKRMIPLVEFSDKEKVNGSFDLAFILVREFNNKYPLSFVNTPLSEIFSFWGFEEAMVKIAMQKELVDCACKCYFNNSIQLVRKAASMGALGIFIEDIYSDMVSIDDFQAYDVYYTSQLIEEIRSLGMNSILYFTGNPTKKLDLLLDIGADAISLEDSKKNFKVDIEDLCEYVNGRCTLLGNLDAISILQNGSDEQIRAEIERQIAAGRKNRSRFIMSLGSPVTPSTHVDRVKLYCDLVHELGVN